jgi:hypothetical protein
MVDEEETIHCLRMSKLIMQWFMFKSQTAEISSDSLLHVDICCKLLASLVLVWVQRYGGHWVWDQLIHNLPATAPQVWLAVWGAVIFISVDHLWSMMSTGSKLSPAGYRHLKLIFVCAGIQAVVLKWYKCWTVCTVCYPCAMCIPWSHNKIIFCQRVYLVFWNFFAYKKTGCSLTEVCSYSRPWKVNVAFCSV